VSEPAIKLTTYFSERDHVGGAFVADALFDVYERHQTHASVLLRGIEGFGRRSRLTDRVLTLSEALPLAAVAVDRPERIERVLADVARVAQHGVITLERALLMRDGHRDRLPLERRPSRVLKLTVYGGRAIRSGGQAGYVEAIHLLRRCGASAASVLLGIDGTLHGERRRARFFARNARVPLMLLAVGDDGAIGKALPGVWRLIDGAVATVEQVQICKSAGERVSDPEAVEAQDPSGMPVWQKLMIHAEEQAQYGKHPMYRELIRKVHEAGGAGATVLRGVRGFYADHEPFFDRVLTLRRNVPVHVVIVDTPDRMRSLWPVVDELTSDSGIVTSELVPASHGIASVHESPRLALAQTPTARPWPAT
jgi:PII-like signaling protein